MSILVEHKGNLSYQMVQLVLLENILDLNQVRDFCWKTSIGKGLANAVVRTWEC